MASLRALGLRNRLGAWQVSTYAFGDESGATARDGRRVYVLAASIVQPDADADAVRATMRGLLLTARQRASTTVKLHWRDEHDERRERITDTLGSLAVITHVAVCLDGAPCKDERARAFCLEELLHMLPLYGVDQLVLEQREPALNQRDIIVAQNARRSGYLASDVRVDHADPTQEELLWIADSVAGAYTTAHTGRPRFWTNLNTADVVRVHQVSYR